MTQNEIIELAKQAGMLQINGKYNIWIPEYIEDFAKLVAEKEREACAKLCDDINAEYEAKDVFSSYAEAIRERGQA